MSVNVPPVGPLVVAPGGLERDDVLALLTEHLAEMRAWARRGGR